MKRAVRSAVVAVAVLANAGAVAACGPRPGRHELEIRELAFPAPPEGVRAGDTLVWVNRDLVPHTVSAEGVWESGALAPGDSFKIALGTAKAFHYLCDYHPTMRGTLVVR